MIDTVVLIIQEDDFDIIDHDKFTPSTRNAKKKQHHKIGWKTPLIYKSNASETLKNKYGYLPRITIIKSRQTTGIKVILKVEFSAPKILHGNNFDELTDEDLDIVIERLRFALMLMGVNTTTEILKHANVSAIHYSKNIPLSGYTTSRMLINELQKQDLNMILDLTKTDYINGGQSLRIHANCYEIIFYDKVKDLQRSRISIKRCIENQDNYQRDLTNSFLAGIEVVRMEVRLNTKAKINSIINKIGLESDNVFKNLFKMLISKKILVYFWSLIRKNMYLACVAQEQPENILDQLLRSKKPKKALEMIGALCVINNIGVRGLGNLITSYYSTSNWYSIRKNLKEADYEVNNRLESVRIFDEGLDDFKPIKITKPREENESSTICKSFK